MAAKPCTSAAKNNVSEKEATSSSQDAMQFTPCTKEKAFMANTSYIATKKGHSSEADYFQSQKG